jgi:putative membrane protein
VERATSSPSDYLAAERTFLAWIRTGLALMGFGFVVARFGLFLRAMQVGQTTFQPHAYGLSVWFGTALIVLGVAVNLTSVWNHVRLVRELRRGRSAFERPSAIAIVVALVLAVLGLAMAIYLASVPDLEQIHVESPRRNQ